MSLNIWRPAFYNISVHALKWLVVDVVDGLVEADTGIQEQLFTVITAGVGMPNGESTQSQELEDNQSIHFGCWFGMQ